LDKPLEFVIFTYHFVFIAALMLAAVLGRVLRCIDSPDLDTSTGA
jgi:hypothetical protein